MRSTFYGLEIAKTALFISRNQMEVTAHNIANIDTEGYSRQSLVTAALAPQGGITYLAENRKSTAGRGVEALYITQVRDVYLDRKYRTETSAASYYTGMADEFSYVTALFDGELSSPDVSSTNILSALKDFEKSLNAISGDKVSTVELRSTVQQAAISLTEAVQYYYGKLEKQHEDINSDLAFRVERVNAIADELSKLNGMIFQFEMDGSHANDLRDTRNNLLDELSTYTHITYEESDKNDFTVMIGDQILVKGQQCNRIVEAQGPKSLLPDPANVPDDAQRLNAYQWEMVDEDGNVTHAPIDWGTGSIKAGLDMRDGLGGGQPVGIPYVVNKLNELVRRIVKDVNLVHKDGWTMPVPKDDGTDDEESITGQLFFGLLDGDGNRIGTYDAGTFDEYLKNINCSNMFVTDKIAKDSDYIAGSSVQVLRDGDGNDHTGDSKIITEMKKLFNATDGVPDNFISLHTALINDVAGRGQSLNNTSASEAVRLHQLDQQRKSLSGVSQDEEITNIVRFNQSYQAASRLLNAMDEQLDVLINRTGMVGR